MPDTVVMMPDSHGRRRPNLASELTCLIDNRWYTACSTVGHAQDHRGGPGWPGRSGSERGLGSGCEDQRPSAGAGAAHHHSRAALRDAAEGREYLSWLRAE